MFWGGAVLLTIGVCLLTVELFCLKFVEVLIRHTFPALTKKTSIVSPKAPIVSKNTLIISKI